MEIRTRLQRAGRTVRVARTAAWVYLTYKITQRRARRRRARGGDDTPLWDTQHERAARSIYGMIVDLKGMFIKTGQFVGTRSDIAPPAYVKYLSRLQDRVPPHPYATVAATIERELGAPVETLFATFERRPVAAASLAQVHRGTLHDGREVAVKVQYPDVEALTYLDIENTQRLVRLIARLEPNFDYRAIADELASQIPLELDFVREAEMATLVRGNLLDDPRIIVPQVIDGYVSRRVVVSEYLHGARLLDAEHRAQYVDDPVELAETIAAVFGRQILVDGVFQADPHPGNLLVLPGGKVGLLDFGLTKELPERYRLGFARFVAGAAERNPFLLAQGFQEMGVRLRGANQAEAQVRLADLMFVEETSGNIESLDRERREALKYNPVEAIPSDLVLIGRVVGLLRGVSASLGKPLNPLEMLAPYAEQALADESTRAAAG
jgi:predicted unusual protein kinase regulating ubiquinone biosynthesis (AarF/ABC1/UbiB family)